MAIVRGPKLPTEQYQILRAIYEWRVVGRPALAGEKKGEMEVFDGVPIYLVHAQFEASGIDVGTTLRLLEIKKLVQPPGQFAHYDGTWELPDGRTVTAKSRPFENDPHDIVIVCGVRTDVYVDGTLIERELDDRRTDLTAAGLELIENLQPKLQKGPSRAELRQRAERYVKTHGGEFPGLRALAKLLVCSPSSLSNAIEDSKYLLARQAEHEEAKNVGRTKPLSRYDLDGARQTREPDPATALNDLVAEQEADLREDSRQTRRSSRRS